MSDAPALQDCFHCGETVPTGADYPVRFQSEIKPACCRGCQAVAQTIVDSGNIDYYRLRTDLPRTPEAALEELKQLKLYDLPEVQQSFVKTEGEIHEASLILEGIVCAACVWLNERHLRQLPGVLSADINFSTHRARVRWDNGRVQLSRILQAVQEIGYLAYPFDTGRQEELFRKERNAAIRRLAIAGLGMMQVMMYAIPVYLAQEGSMGLDIQALMRFASMILTTPVVFYSAWPFFQGAWRDLKLRRAGMDVPVALGVGAAFAASIYGTFTSSADVYFDSVTMFVFFLLTGRFLEMNARKRSAEAAESLVKLIPAAATRLPGWPDRHEEELVAAVKLATGDHVLVGPGDSFPADGTVAEGRSSVDESLLTGESHPLGKHEGSPVIGGTINLSSPLVVRVDKIGADTVLSGIVRLLDRAVAEKPRLAQLADKVASYFTYGLLALTVVVGLAWWWLEPARAFEIVLAVLVVTCPCALSLAAPAAFAAAGSHLLKRGILMTRGHALETLAKVTHVVLDKTGTLTHGKPVLQQTVALADLPEHVCLALAASLERASEHPLADSFLSQVAPTDLQEVRQPQNLPGKGVMGAIGGVSYTLGSRHMSSLTENCAQPDGVPQGATLVWLCDEHRTLALFVLSDGLRPEAAQLVARLKQRGVSVTILSGDAEDAVAHVAAQAGIAAWRSGMRPEDKLAALREFQQRGEIVAMVGDGVNDAPVLAGADVSIAMGGGTQVARSSSDIVLLAEHLLDIVRALETGHASMAVMRQNFAWAIVYNLIALPFAAVGMIPPWLASLGMSASSLVVVLNALRLR